MEIVLDTVFSNPALPLTPRPGFVDMFGAADGPLRYTTDLKPWVFTSSSANPMWVRSGGKAVLGPGSPSAAALVDGLASDGVLTQTIGNVGASHKGSLIFRRVDGSNFLSLAWSHNGTNTGYYRLYKTVSGSLSQVAATTTVADSGDVIEVTLSGTSVGVTVNGAAVAAGTVADFADATVFGMEQSATDATGSVDSMVFVAA